jgi:hypothetical protein
VLPWLVAWQIRNRVETGYYGFTSVTDINLYFQAASGVTAYVEHRPFLEARKDSGYVDFADNSGQIYLFPPYLARHPEQAGWSQGQRLAFMRSEAVGIIGAHKGVYLRMCLISLLRTELIPGEQYFDHLLYPEEPNRNADAVYENQRRWAILPSKQGFRGAAERIVFSIALLVLYLLAARGVFRGVLRNPHLGLLLGIVLYCIFITAVGEEPGGNLRYRLPVMPVVCIFAAAGFLRKREIEEIRNSM